MKPKAYVTRIIPPPGLSILEGFFHLTVHDAHTPPSKDEIIRNITDKDAILCLLTDTIDKEMLEAAPELKVISTMSAGFEHIDVHEATRRGIYIGYTPAVLTEATADLTFALLLSAARQVPMADRFVRDGQWKVSWSPAAFLGQSIWEGVLGIIGLGRIGRAVARRARGFNMKILYTDVKRVSPEEEEEAGIEYRLLDELLRESDFVTIHTPLTSETYGMINEKRLGLMKQNAILVNTSRGTVIHERSLVTALKEKRIAAAALDVFENEPIREDSELLTVDNVVLAPHIGSATTQTRAKMSELSAWNLLYPFKGMAPPHWLNPDVEEIRSLSTMKIPL